MIRMDARVLITSVCFFLATKATESYGQEGWSPFLDLPFGRATRFPTNWPEQFGAEELYDGDDSPRIPEPMVFDLVRPLGAKRGEAEINALAIIPMNRRTGVAEWAPEVEFAIADGIALEFELPFDEWTLQTYKMAGQVTFGKTFNDSFIHGAQSIVEYRKGDQKWETALLYLAGIQFDDTWSMLSMIGIRTVIGGDDRSERTERLFNLSLFKHVGDYTTLGVETNSAVDLAGTSEFRLMPQVHHELRDHIMLQFGAGYLLKRKETVPEFAFRLIYSF